MKVRSGFSPAATPVPDEDLPTTLEFRMTGHSTIDTRIGRNYRAMR